jgi:hypothetical protein
MNNPEIFSYGLQHFATIYSGKSAAFPTFCRSATADRQLNNFGVIVLI